MKNQGNVIINNIEELLIKEYYMKYLPKNSEILKKPPNTIYDREILNIYSNILIVLENKLIVTVVYLIVFVQFLAFGDLDFLLKMFCNIDHSWPQLVFWRTLLESLFALCNLKRNLAKNKNENIGFRPPLHDHQILIQRERKIEE